jgi:hypothetical protein
MHKLGLYEEQLYELLMHVRNDKSQVADDGKEKENQNQSDIVGSITKRLNGYVSVSYFPMF